MKRIKLKDYTGEMVCAVNRFKDNEYLYPDEEEEIKDLKENGYIIYGTTFEKVFDNNFIEYDLRELFERYAEDNGYEDMEERLEFDGEKYEKIKKDVKEYIESLEDANKVYYCDKNIIIEV